MPQTKNLGKVAFTPRGDYVRTTVYYPLDIINHQGTSYIVKQQCTGVEPPNDNYYQKIAQKGDTGANGAAATIAVGTVTTVPSGNSAAVSNAGSSSAAVFNFTIPQGSKWYYGDKVTGTTTTGRVFSNSGITNAGIGDMYLNNGTDANRGNVYSCVLGGNAVTAKWAYVTSILGTMSNAVSYLSQSGFTTQQRIAALANVGLHLGTTDPAYVTTSTVPVGELYGYIQQ